MPRETIEINVNGTYNVLEFNNKLESVKACLVITSDKVYENIESNILYKEFDKLGGYDPYSTSKAMADLLTQSWARSFGSKKYFIARAGNVIGGGDFGIDRLIPDFFKSYSAKKPLVVRNPFSIRPWQHVLDCLSGYLTLLNNFEKIENGSCWNFGPEKNEHRNVSDVLSELNKNIVNNVQIHVENSSLHHEAKNLMLNSEKSRRTLTWKEKLDFESTIKWTVDWYESFQKGQNPLEITQSQIKSYLSL
jgi:CDP-glucose 4,6-dehydratase